MLSLRFISRPVLISFQVRPQSSTFLSTIVSRQIHHVQLSQLNLQIFVGGGAPERIYTRGGDPQSASSTSTRRISRPSCLWRISKYEAPHPFYLLILTRLDTQRLTAAAVDDHPSAPGTSSNAFPSSTDSHIDLQPIATVLRLLPSSSSSSSE